MAATLLLQLGGGCKKPGDAERSPGNERRESPGLRAPQVIERLFDAATKGDEARFRSCFSAQSQRTLDALMRHASGDDGVPPSPLRPAPPSSLRPAPPSPRDASDGDDARGQRDPIGTTKKPASWLPLMKIHRRIGRPRVVRIESVSPSSMRVTLAQGKQTSVVTLILESGEWRVDLPSHRDFGALKGALNHIERRSPKR